jgi:hypothetical protein
VKNSRSAIAAVDNVITNISNTCSCSPWHKNKLCIITIPVKKIMGTFYIFFLWPFLARKQKNTIAEKVECPHYYPHFFIIFLIDLPVEDITLAFGLINDFTEQGCRIGSKIHLISSIGSNSPTPMA